MCCHYEKFECEKLCNSKTAEEDTTRTFALLLSLPLSLPLFLSPSFSPPPSISLHPLSPPPTLCTGPKFCAKSQRGLGKQLRDTEDGKVEANRLRIYREPISPHFSSPTWQARPHTHTHTHTHIHTYTHTHTDTPADTQTHSVHIRLHFRISFEIEE